MFLDASLEARRGRQGSFHYRSTQCPITSSTVHSIATPFHLAASRITSSGPAGRSLQPAIKQAHARGRDAVGATLPACKMFLVLLLRYPHGLHNKHPWWPWRHCHGQGPAPPPLPTRNSTVGYCCDCGHTWVVARCTFPHAVVPHGTRVHGSTARMEHGHRKSKSTHRFATLGSRRSSFRSTPPYANVTLSLN